LKYFAKSVVINKKNTMPGKADKTLQNSALQSISEQEKFMIRVLFICHGNICRSPMAEFILKDIVTKRGIADQFEIASAATSTEEIWNGVGNPVYPPARGELARHGISCKGKRAVQLTASDYDHYDYLIGMDSMNMRNIERMTGHRRGDKIYKMLEFAGRDADVRDPWYSRNFRETYEDVVEGCQAFLDWLTINKKLSN
jgi:protein-tyrosine phosphatase